MTEVSSAVLPLVGMVRPTDAKRTQACSCGLSSQRKPSIQDDSGALADEGSAPACAQADRRIVRSRRALRDALIELVAEHGYDAITVNDICDRANLNRGTFYNHFKDKDDLALSLQDEFFEGLLRFKGEVEKLTLFDLVRFKFAKRPLPLLVGLFDYLRSQQEYLAVMLSPGGDARLPQRLQDTFCTDLIMGMLHDRYHREPTPLVEYYVAFYSAAYLGVIRRWMLTGMQEPSEEMAVIAMRLLFIKPGESITL